MTTFEVFLWGAGGSLAVEALAWAKIYSVKGRIKVPERYSFFGFYASQLVLATIAGAVTVAYAIDKPLLALNIGAAAPLIIQAFKEGISGRIDEG